jgi:hypothetical protein
LFSGDAVECCCFKSSCVRFTYLRVIVIELWPRVRCSPNAFPPWRRY